MIWDKFLGQNQDAQYQADWKPDDEEEENFLEAGISFFAKLNSRLDKVFKEQETKDKDFNERMTHDDEHLPKKTLKKEQRCIKPTKKKTISKEPPQIDGQ